MSFIIANWKSNGSRQQAREWGAEVARQLPALRQERSGRGLCIAAPYVLLPEFAVQIAQYEQANPSAAGSFTLAAQNLSAHPAGAYTGELHGELLKEFCDYVLIGHSERRALFGEDEAVLAAKLKQALAVDLAPIFCLGENERQREAGKTEQVLQQQLQPVLAAIAAQQDASIIIAYEPVWAIGTGKAATADIAAAAHAFIKQQLAQAGAAADPAHTIPVVYGGSVKPDNAAEFLAQEQVDGLLVGGASLQASSILQIFSA